MENIINEAFCDNGLEQETLNSKMLEVQCAQCYRLQKQHCKMVQCYEHARKPRDIKQVKLFDALVSELKLDMILGE